MVICLLFVPDGQTRKHIHLQFVHIVYLVHIIFIWYSDMDNTSWTWYNIHVVKGRGLNSRNSLVPRNILHCTTWARDLQALTAPTAQLENWNRKRWARHKAHYVRDMPISNKSTIYMDVRRLWWSLNMVRIRLLSGSPNAERLIWKSLLSDFAKAMFGDESRKAIEHYYSCNALYVPSANQSQILHHFICELEERKHGKRENQESGIGNF